MIPVRVIPCLLLRGRGLVKTTRFDKPTYLGDPINAVKIFNDKQADELIFLDITATAEHRGPPFELLEQIASECFMPLAFGGGITDLAQIRRLFSLGIEKICINTMAARDPSLISRAADLFGNQSIVAAIDAKKKLMGRYDARIAGGKERTSFEPAELAVRLEAAGAGEIFLNSIDRDGTMDGYDLDLVRSVTSAVSVPVIACGGARGVDDLSTVIRDGGASAAAAGSMFVFTGRHRAVLISYPSQTELQSVLRVSQDS